MVRRIQVTGLFMVTPEAISTPECICMFQAKVWVVACRHALIYSAPHMFHVVLHRYPVHYARDVPEGEPQRVWLFDEPIVIARRPGNCNDLGAVLKGHSAHTFCTFGASIKPVSIIC